MHFIYFEREERRKGELWGAHMREGDSEDNFRESVLSFDCAGIGLSSKCLCLQSSVLPAQVTSFSPRRQGLLTPRLASD